MNNGNNAAQGKHLESITAAIKRYILAQIQDATNALSAELAAASGAGVLDTVPATVNGGMWYELTDNVPSVIKLKHGNHTLSLTPSIVNISPALTASPAAATVPVDGSVTATVSYSGAGSVTVTGSNGISPTYDAANKLITVPYSYDTASTTITVSLAASYGYLADETSFNLSMAKASPNLSVTPSASSTDGDDITATISYSGGGTVTVESDNSNVTPTLSGSTITVPYHAFTDDDHSVTITVSVAANGNYSAQSATFQVLFEKVEAYLDPQLTLTDIDPFDDRVLGSQNEGRYVSYLGNGTLTATTDEPDVTVIVDIDSPYYDPAIIIERDMLLAQPHTGTYTCTVSLSASPPYRAVTTTFTYSGGGGSGSPPIVD